MLVGVASLHPTLWNIGILHYKQAKLRKHLQHSVLSENIQMRRYNRFYLKNKSSEPCSIKKLLCNLQRVFIQVSNQTLGWNTF